MEGATIAKGPCKELKGLELEVTLVRNVVEYKGCKVGLTGKRAEAGELRNLDMNPIVTLRRWVAEGFKGGGGRAGH